MTVGRPTTFFLHFTQIIKHFAVVVIERTAGLKTRSTDLSLPPLHGFLCLSLARNSPPGRPEFRHRSSYTVSLSQSRSYVMTNCMLCHHQNSVGYCSRGIHKNREIFGGGVFCARADCWVSVYLERQKEEWFHFLLTLRE